MEGAPMATVSETGGFGRQQSVAIAASRIANALA